MTSRHLQTGDTYEQLIQMLVSISFKIILLKRLMTTYKYQS